MTISREREVEILRLYHVEHWRISTIARELGIHHGTVARVLAQAGLPPIGPPLRPSMIDPYLPFLRETLAKYPRLTASRLYGMVRERGYSGGPNHFRHLIARHRPRPKHEAYLRLRTLPGEQMQCDWAHMGHLEIGRARRTLMAFVLVLSYSRRIFLRFYLDARMGNFLRGHVEAFQQWGGLARVCLYDNLKSAVLERQGDAIRFHPELLSLAAHYRFEPRPCAVARGNEKGRVERAIRFIRDSFFAARTFVSLADLNAQADAWSQGLALERRLPENPTLTVREAFGEEQARLLLLPANPYPAIERVVVKAGKTPYVRFDLNDYSIPATHVGRTLEVLAEPERVRIVEGETVLASHARDYGKGEQIEDPAHIAALAQEKRAAREHRAIDRLTHAVPIAREFLIAAAGRAEILGAVTSQLMRLLDRYGAAELDVAMREALARGVAHPNAVRLALERRRHERGEPPPVAVVLPEHVRGRDIVVTPHALDTYDQLGDTDEEH
jgi:transposase